ncbi:hypothetical protein VSH64_27745 [Amycolatopsis rhabdoformis]|uniref:Septum formation-related domain-containing protein n=1 Tax=Amycolatopsis rhabdoformis TaxID=1448059 RepID=A0ABZ1HYL5_9PSEU|nr:hypothetical protein [Amycolatopsis rhabdoformis]WSE26672.1 hypothetical protein VSH64_27745 [Amycolatopsis rhabdoformis]
MTTERELLDQALGSAQPPLSLDFEAIEAQGVRAVRRRTRFALVGTAAVVLLVGLGGTVLFTRGSPTLVTPAAGGPVTTAKPSERGIAYCYENADITSSASGQHVPFGISGHGPNGRGDAAAESLSICATAWAEDYHQWQKPGLPRVVPPLVACVLTSAAVDIDREAIGAVGVFPGNEQTCAAMGLAVAKI